MQSDYRWINISDINFGTNISIFSIDSGMDKSSHQYVHYIIDAMAMEPYYQTGA